MRKVLVGLVSITATLVATVSLATAEVVVYGAGGLSFSHEQDWVFSIGVSNHGSWLWQRGGNGTATVQAQSVTTRIAVNFAAGGRQDTGHILMIDDLSGAPSAIIVADAVRGEVFPIFNGDFGDAVAFDFWNSDVIRAEVIVPAEAGGSAVVVRNLRTGESVTAAAPGFGPDPFAGPIRLSFYTGASGQIAVLRVEIEGESVVPDTPSTWSRVKALYR